MKRLAMCSFALCLLALMASAQFIGDVITISDAPGAQQFPDVAYNSTDNTFLVVWEAVSEDDVVDIHGSLHNGYGGEIIGEPHILMVGEDDILAPEVTYNSTDNEFLVVARHKPQDKAWAVRVSAQGEAIGEPVEVGTSRGPTFFDPAARARVVSVCYNATDNMYAVGLSQPPNIQFMTPDLEYDSLITDIGVGTNSSIAWSSESNVYLIAWEDRQSRATGGENLSAQVISNTGDYVGEVIHIRDQDFAEESPRVAYNPDTDEFLVVWDERIGFAEGNNSRTDTIAQRVSVDGNLLGDPIIIEGDTPYTLRQDVDYTLGRYLVVWKGDESGNFAFADIFGRFVDVHGAVVSDTILLYDGGDDESDDGGSNERYYDESKLPVVAANTISGEFFVVWEEGYTNRNPDDRDILSGFVTGYEIVNPVSNWELLD